MYQRILVDAKRLRTLIRADLCLVIDCRFALTDPDKGQQDWLEEHIPGARYAHLDRDLAGPVTALTGRHPLPDPVRFSEFLATVGWTPETLLVAYDDGSNGIAVRLWWLMHYFGQSAALLDGGLAAWKTAGYPVESGTTITFASSMHDLTPNVNLSLSVDEVRAGIESGSVQVLDARAEDRFHGVIEPLDSRAGHIPGAINRPFQANLDDNGRFKSPEKLRAEFQSLLTPVAAKRLAHSCGSGVTACHNFFAMELAGLSPSHLYPGSWSEWIRDPNRPIETDTRE